MWACSGCGLVNGLKHSACLLCDQLRPPSLLCTPQVSPMPFVQSLLVCSAASDVACSFTHQPGPRMFLVVLMLQAFWLCCEIQTGEIQTGATGSETPVSTKLPLSVTRCPLCASPQPEGLIVKPPDVRSRSSTVSLAEFSPACLWTGPARCFLLSPR